MVGILGICTTPNTAASTLQGFARKNWAPMLAAVANVSFCYYRSTIHRCLHRPWVLVLAAVLLQLTARHVWPSLRAQVPRGPLLVAQCLLRAPARPLPLLRYITGTNLKAPGFPVGRLPAARCWARLPPAGRPGSARDPAPRSGSVRGPALRLRKAPVACPGSAEPSGSHTGCASARAAWGLCNPTIACPESATAKRFTCRPGLARVPADPAAARAAG